jgi:histidyl-tRNA synthetase
MKSANKLGARWVVLIVAAEAKRRVAQLRDMASGEQVEVAWADLPARLA